MKDADEIHRGKEQSEAGGSKRPLGPAGLPSIVIMGRKASDGSAFRPSDWAERLIGVLDVFGDASRSLGNWARCEQAGNTACVRVSAILRSENVHAWGFMMGFAADNGLSVSEEAWPMAPDRSADGGRA